MTQTPVEAIASTVRAEAARRNIRQPRIAAALGLNQQQVSRRMLGQTAFSAAELGQVAALLEVPVGVLMGETDSAEVPA